MNSSNRSKKREPAFLGLLSVEPVSAKEACWKAQRQGMDQDGKYGTLQCAMVFVVLRTAEPISNEGRYE
jgi:hypothetical protein